MAAVGRKRTFPLPIVDHHAHLRPGPSGIAAAKAFARTGGTHLFLATQNYLPRPPTSLQEYEEQFALTERLAREVHAATGVVVFVVLAPYPIDLAHTAPSLGLRAAEDLQVAALEVAAREVRDGRAVALGEVGWAHFEVSPEVRAAEERVLGVALRLAKECGCPAVLHTGDLDASGYRNLSEVVRRSGLPVERAIKHYAREVLPPSERAGITPSFLAKRDVVREALADPGPFFLETDFLDDPTRPGVALPLETLPKRVQAALTSAPTGALTSGEEWWEPFRRPFEEAPRRLYGLDLERTTPWEFEGRGAA